MKKGIVTILLGSIAVWAQAADLKARGRKGDGMRSPATAPGGVSATRTGRHWPDRAKIH